MSQFQFVRSTGTRLFHGQNPTMSTMNDPLRIGPNKSVKIGSTIVRNGPSNSIEVQTEDQSGTLTIAVTDCCLEEQGK
jgi:hypothetical protein